MSTQDKGPMSVTFFHAETINQYDPNTGVAKRIQDQRFGGRTTGEIGNTQENGVEISLSHRFLTVDKTGFTVGAARPTFATDEQMGRSMAHEFGHVLGLHHPFEDPKAGPMDVLNSDGLLPLGNPATVIDNLMNSPGNDLPSLNPTDLKKTLGNKLTTNQRQQIEINVQSQQPKK